MKIEMGESLFYSWLRHVKECQAVQTNWKPSPAWQLQNEDELRGLMHAAAVLFKASSHSPGERRQAPAAGMAGTARDIGREVGDGVLDVPGPKNKAFPWPKKQSFFLGRRGRRPLQIQISIRNSVLEEATHEPQKTP